MILEVMSTYAPIADLLRIRLEESRTERVVDLCSGAGGPWPSLVRDFEMQGATPPQVFLTDKYPSTRKLDDLESPRLKRIHYVEQSIDATQIPKNFQGFRTLFSSFHHFDRDEACRLLQDSVNRKEGIGIFEAPGRHALTFLSLFFIPIAVWLFTPFRRPFRWSRLIWTYLIPLIPFVLFFDGFVSCLRAYSLEELEEMIDGLPQNEYRWELGEEVGELLPLRITYLIGSPLSGAVDSAD
jgi:hypothetical protein